MTIADFICEIRQQQSELSALQRKELIEILTTEEYQKDIFWPQYFCDESYREHVVASAPPIGYTIEPIENCKVVGCNDTPSHNFSGERAYFCESHAVPGMVNVITTKCEGRGCEAYVARTGFCAQCDTTRPRRTRVREFQVANFLRENLEDKWTTWNKQLSNSKECSNGGGYLPDFVYDRGSHVIILEVDEHQHSAPGYSCDERRMIDCFNSCGGTPVMFIRFNPDEFKENGINVTVDWSKRLEVLKLFMKEYIDHPHPAQIAVLRLFYDTAIPECIAQLSEVSLDRGMFEESFIPDFTDIALPTDCSRRQTNLNSIRQVRNHNKLQKCALSSVIKPFREGRNYFDNTFSASSVDIRDRVFLDVKQDIQKRMLFTNVCAIMEFDLENLKQSVVFLQLPILAELVILAKKLVQTIGLQQLYDRSTIVHESVLERAALLPALEKALKLLKQPIVGQRRKTQINHVFKFFGCELKGKRNEHRIGKGKKTVDYDYKMVIKETLVSDIILLVDEQQRILS